MTPVMKGVLAAAIQVALVASVGARLVVDRATLPRVWVRAAPVDPSLPIRGRYVSLRVEADLAPGVTLPPAPLPPPQPGPAIGNTAPVTGTLPAPLVAVGLMVENGELVARPSRGSSRFARAAVRDARAVARLEQPLAYFIPDRIPDPSRRAPGEELWVEVTVPPHGSIRPIRLGVKKDGVLTPLNFD